MQSTDDGYEERIMDAESAAREPSDVHAPDAQPATDEDCCVIAFQPEAYDSAAASLRRFIGWTMDVKPTDGEQFCAVLVGVDGEVAVLDVWSDEDDGPSGEITHADLYGTRFEVI
jgi:hypothetical protein